MKIKHLNIKATLIGIGLFFIVLDFFTPPFKASEPSLRNHLPAPHWMIQGKFGLLINSETAANTNAIALVQQSGAHFIGRVLQDIAPDTLPQTRQMAQAAWNVNMPFAIQLNTPLSAANWPQQKKDLLSLYPDFIAFGPSFGDRPEKERLKFAAAYFNQAHKSKQEVALATLNQHLSERFSPQIRTQAPDRVLPRFWIDSADADTLTSRRALLHRLIDTVSKRGILLLELNDDQLQNTELQQALRGAGQWLETWGDAIYGTYPFEVCGEGPAQLPPDCTSQNVRYTTRDGRIIYAIVLNRLEPRESILLPAFKKLGAHVDHVSQLGAKRVMIPWESSTDGLKILAPLDQMDADAVVFKIRLNDPEPAE